MAGGYCIDKNNPNLALLSGDNSTIFSFLKNIFPSILYSGYPAIAKARVLLPLPFGPMR